MVILLSVTIISWHLVMPGNLGITKCLLA